MYNDHKKKRAALFSIRLGRFISVRVGQMPSKRMRCFTIQCHTDDFIHCAPETRSSTQCGSALHCIVCGQLKRTRFGRAVPPVRQRRRHRRSHTWATSTTDAANGFRSELYHLNCCRLGSHIARDAAPHSTRRPSTTADHCTDPMIAVRRLTHAEWPSDAARKQRQRIGAADADADTTETPQTTAAAAVHRLRNR